MIREILFVFGQSVDITHQLSVISIITLKYSNLALFSSKCYDETAMISKENKYKAIALTQVNKNDVGSPQAQVSVLTARIKEVTEHLKANKHDFMTRRGLIQMVGKRKRLLKYLERTDFESYKQVVAKLGLRK